MLFGGELAYRALRLFNPPSTWLSRLTNSSPPTPSKLESYWGKDVWDDLRGRTVVDFGCRTGADALEIARHGARHVIGLDIVPAALAVAARAAARAKLADRCTFTTSTTVKADRILCIDAFEHFDDPAGVLDVMAGMLRPDGCVLVTFGPPWLHPRGGHSFSVFPWAHMLFTERALLRWRADYRDDGARRFREVEGGLNQMTVRRFEQLVAHSPFRFAAFETIPIRALRLLHNRLTREWTTSMVRCKLTLKPWGRSQPWRSEVTPGRAPISTGVPRPWENANQVVDSGPFQRL
jgi:SAM-dependent methyltransferase